MLRTRKSIPQRLRSPTALGHVLQPGGVQLGSHSFDRHVVALGVYARQQHAWNELSLPGLGWIAVSVFPALGLVNAQSHAAGPTEQLHDLVQTKKFRANKIAFAKPNG